MMMTMAFIMGIFLTLLVAALCSALVFAAIDMLFDHRISRDLRKWYDRKFGVE